jgi:hypothetical protein
MEQRLSPRFTLGGLVTFEVKSGTHKDKTLAAELRDVSDGGIGLVMEVGNFARGTEVRLIFPSGLPLTAWICHCAVRDGITCIVFRSCYRMRTVWGLRQRISVEEAIRVGTIHGAHASFEERLKGSLEPGKLADLVVLGQVPLRVDPSKLISVPVEEQWSAAAGWTRVELSRLDDVAYARRVAVKRAAPYSPRSTVPDICFPSNVPL